MELAGLQEIDAPRQRVWEALNDPTILHASIPGCENLERLGDNEFSATVKAAVGPVKATFNGTVRLADLDPPNGYTLSGEGKGGAAGFAKGSAKVSLEDAADGKTVLRYTVKANVGGQLARIGGRLIDAASKKMADEFFASFREQVEGVAAPPVEAVTERRPGLAPIIWGGALILLVLAYLWYLSQ